MTYQDAIQFLYHLRWFGAKFGLENTLRLAAMAGNPQHRLRFIHVAGTNGKGSTCAMLESICRVAGLKTGLFTSPHLVSFSERIQVNRRLIPEADVARLVAEIQPWLAAWERTEKPDGTGLTHPTFFEVVTVLALRYFAEQQCDIVIWETGLGGRLDATNIVTPLASLITNIQFDHQEWLGDTLASIATEKAGIIKPGIPALTTAEAPEALEVLTRLARERTAPLTIVTAADAKRPPLDTLELPLFGSHQRLNAALAVTSLRQLSPPLPITEEHIRVGLSHVDWPGRLQLITRSPGRRTLLDGAHNVAGAVTLAEAVRSRFPEERPTLILGILRDKDTKGVCRTLAPLAARILLTPVSSERTAPTEELYAACVEVNPSARIELCGSPREAFTLAEPDPFVVITGSLYLVGEALEWFRSPEPRQNPERALNEWSSGAKT